MGTYTYMPRPLREHTLLPILLSLLDMHDCPGIQKEMMQVATVKFMVDVLGQAVFLCSVLPRLLAMLSVKDTDVEQACERALVFLIDNCGLLVACRFILQPLLEQMATSSSFSCIPTLKKLAVVLGDRAVLHYYLPALNTHLHTQAAKYTAVLTECMPDDRAAALVENALSSALSLLESLVDCLPSPLVSRMLASPRHASAIVCLLDPPIPCVSIYKHALVLVARCVKRLPGEDGTRVLLPLVVAYFSRFTSYHMPLNSQDASGAGASREQPPFPSAPAQSLGTTILSSMATLASRPSWFDRSTGIASISTSPATASATPHPQAATSHTTLPIGASPSGLTPSSKLTPVLYTHLYSPELCSFVYVQAAAVLPRNALLAQLQTFSFVLGVLRDAKVVTDERGEYRRRRASGADGDPPFFAETHQPSELKASKKTYDGKKSEHLVPRTTDEVQGRGSDQADSWIFQVPLEPESNRPLFGAEVVHSVKAHSGAVRTLDLDASEETLLSGSKDGAVKVWQVVDAAAAVATYSNHKGSTVKCVRFLGARTAASMDTAIQVWDVSRCTPLLTLGAATPEATITAFCPAAADHTLLSTSSLLDLSIFDTRAGDRAQMHALKYYSIG